MEQQNIHSIRIFQFGNRKIGENTTLQVLLNLDWACWQFVSSSILRSPFVELHFKNSITFGNLRGVRSKNFETQKIWLLSKAESHLGSNKVIEI